MAKRVSKTSVKKEPAKPAEPDKFTFRSTPDAERQLYYLMDHFDEKTKNKVINKAIESFMPMVKKCNEKEEHIEFLEKKLNEIQDNIKTFIKSGRAMDSFKSIKNLTKFTSKIETEIPFDND